MNYSIKSGVHGRSRGYRRTGPKPSGGKKFISNSFALLFVGACIVQVGFELKSSMQQPETTAMRYASSTPPEVIEVKPAILVTERFDKNRVQTVVDSWSAKHPNVGVVVTTADGVILGQAKADERFFAASIYKLYVAYAGYKAIDTGAMSASAPFVQGMTRQQCIDDMVRNSNSICAERILAELGKATVQAEIQNLGMKNTSVAGLTTTAGDTSLMLQILQRGEGLSAESHQMFLGSLHAQKYRNALAKGFAGLDVYNKVGFRDLNEYHDVAIVKLTDGTPLVVSVFTKNTGNKNIAQFATQLVLATQPQ